MGYSSELKKLKPQKKSEYWNVELKILNVFASLEQAIYQTCCSFA